MKNEPGSIPTCVGQPLMKRLPWRVKTVYPHVCGAAIHAILLNRCCRGLSPRVWGSREHFCSPFHAMRSIPTCVGQPRHGYAL